MCNVRHGRRIRSAILEWEITKMIVQHLIKRQIAVKHFLKRQISLKHFPK